MSPETRERLNGLLKVPTWVMTITYILCWGWACAIMLGTLVGWIGFRPLMMGLALYLLFWPVFQVSPGILLKHLFGRG